MSKITCDIGPNRFVAEGDSEEALGTLFDEFLDVVRVTEFAIPLSNGKVAKLTIPWPMRIDDFGLIVQTLTQWREALTTFPHEPPSGAEGGDA